MPPYPSSNEILINHIAGGIKYTRDSTFFTCDEPSCNILNTDYNSWYTATSTCSLFFGEPSPGGVLGCRNHFAFVADIEMGSVIIYVNGIQVWNETQLNSDFQRSIIKGGVLSIGQSQYSIGKYLSLFINF
jgi:hypothetical protein